MSETAVFHMAKKIFGKKTISSCDKRKIKKEKEKETVKEKGRK